MNTALVRRAVAIHSVPPRILIFTAMASYAAQLVAIVQGWPLWAIVLATLLPWVPIFTLEMVWTYRHYQWLALFYVLVVTQGGHFMEHVVQVGQIHLMGVPPAAAHGIFGALDIEWVHFVWNSFVLIAVVLLLVRFRRNPWLWVTLAVAGWHEIEHAFIMTRYLTTGVAGTPGLLSQGGIIGGGLPFIRPNVHFFYNLVETVPLAVAFVWQLKHTYDEWLAKALPHLPESLLAETTNRLQTLRFAPGEAVVRQGEPADRFYIITRGQVSVTRSEPGDPPTIGTELATLGPGEYFGEIGLLTHAPRNATVRAKSGLEVLALDSETFNTLVDRSSATASDLAQIVQRRLARAS
jgi:hypothetical protein